MILNESLRDFARALASRQPVPGGGSASGYVGALGAALAQMAIAYSQPKENRDEEEGQALMQGASRMEKLREDLLTLAEKDCEAYSAFSEAMKLPRGNREEKAARKETLRTALQGAMAVPREAAVLCVTGLEILAPLCPALNPRLITDAGVAAQCFRAGFEGCWYNVMVNALALKDEEILDNLSQQKAKLDRLAQEGEKKILAGVDRVLHKK
jgi:formiminotetrahydrofolate cyclodeaminase